MANMAAELYHRRPLPSPSLVFHHMDHVDMRQLDSGPPDVEIYAVGTGHVTTGLYAFAMWIGESRAAHGRGPHLLATYLHQLISPGSHPMPPQHSSLHRLPLSEMQPWAVTWAVELNLHLWHMVLAVRCLERLPAVLSERHRAAPTYSLVWGRACLVGHGEELSGHLSGGRERGWCHQ